MIDFPNAPTVGQTHTAANGVVWKWDGTAWLIISSGSSSDSVYVNVTGDTMTGDLAVPNVSVSGNVTTGGMTAASIGGSGAGASLNMNGNWMPFQDAANYFDANGHNFRTRSASELAVVEPAGQIRVTAAAPTAANHLARKDYVDGAVKGFNFVQEATPTATAVGQTWWQTSTGRAAIWTSDGTSSQWVEY